MKKITFGGVSPILLKLLRSQIRPLILLILLFPLFIYLGALFSHTGFAQIDDRFPHHLTHYLAQDPNSIKFPITLEGRIIEPPENFTRKTRLHLEVQKIILPRQNVMTTVMTSENVQLTWYAPKIRCKFYDMVQVTAKLQLPLDYRNPGGFSYADYLSQKDIYTTGTIKTLALYNKAKTIPLPMLILRWIYEFRSRVSEYIENTTSAPDSNLLQAILLGERHKVSNQMKELFSDAGTVHLLSVSGFHLIILALATFFCIRFFLHLLPDRLFESLSCLIRPSHLAALLSIPVVIFYTILTGSRTSTIRACIIVILYFLSLLFERRKTLWRPLILAAFCILLWQPSAIFRVDFQLTFLASAGIIFMLEYLFAKAPLRRTQGRGEEGTKGLADKETGGQGDKKIKGQRDVSPSPPLPLSPSPFQRFLAFLRRYILLSCCLSLAAFLMTSPLTAYFFNLVSPVGILTNLLATPLVAGILYTGLGATLMIPFCPGLAGILFRIGALFTRLIVSLNTSAIQVPRAFFYLPSPPRTSVFIIYICIFISALLLRYWTKNSSPARKITFLIPTLFFLLVLLFFLLTPSPRPNHRDLTVTFLDVGKGDACVIQTPKGKNILIDGGGSYNQDEFDFGHSVVAPYLWHEKIDKLDLVVLTHPHPDHLNGLLFILKNFPVALLWKTKEQAKYREYRLFEKIIGEKRIPVRTPAVGEQFDLDGNLLEVLADGNLSNLPISTKISFRDENNRSLVLKLSYRQISFLFTGDIESKVERCLLPLGEKIRSTILKVPHHGSRYSSSLPFLQMVRPQAVVFSARNYGKQQFPHPMALARYQKLPCQIYRTDLDGAITIETDGTGFKVSPYAKVNKGSDSRPAVPLSPVALPAR